MNLHIRYSVVLVLTLLGCAAGPVEREASRASAGTLVDESNEGAYDAWDVLAPSDDDQSVVIVGSGPSGATGTVRFLASDDGSVTVIIEADGTSSQLDLDADGTVAGEAHAPAADALLAELVHDLGNRQDELVALVAGGPAPEEGAAREALVLGVDFACVWSRVVAFVSWSPTPACALAPAAASELKLFVHTWYGTLLSAQWRVTGRPLDAAQPMVLTRSDSEGRLTLVNASIPQAALDLGTDIELTYTEGRVEKKQILHTRGSWEGLRLQVLILGWFCGGRGAEPCDANVCMRTGGQPAVCSDTF